MAMVVFRVQPIVLSSPCVSLILCGIQLRSKTVVAPAISWSLLSLVSVASSGVQLTITRQVAHVVRVCAHGHVCRAGVIGRSGRTLAWLCRGPRAFREVSCRRGREGGGKREEQRCAEEVGEESHHGCGLSLSDCDDSAYSQEQEQNNWKNDRVQAGGRVGRSKDVEIQKETSDIFHQ